MTTLRAFIRKEFRHLWRDKRSLFVIVAMPVLMLALYGFALSNEVKNSRIAVIVPVVDEASRSLIARINASRYFTVTHFPESPDQIEPLFRKGKIRAALIFESDFEQSLQKNRQAAIQMVIDAADTNTGITVANYLNGIIQSWQMDFMQSQEPPLRIALETRMTYNPQLKSAYNFVPGVMVLITILLCAMLTSVAIVRERESGSLELILVSPAQPWMMIVAKTLPFFAVGMLNMTIILLIAYTALGLPTVGNLPLIVAECALFVLLALSLGLFISTRTDSQQTALFISLVGLMLPSLIFSGFMFPIESMPIPMQVVSNIVPTKYFFNILKSLMIKGLGFSYVWKDTLVMALMTAAFAGMAIRSFKVRLE